MHTCAHFLFIPLNQVLHQPYTVNLVEDIDTLTFQYEVEHHDHGHHFDESC